MVEYRDLADIVSKATECSSSASSSQSEEASLLWSQDTEGSFSTSITETNSLEPADVCEGTSFLEPAYVCERSSCLSGFTPYLIASEGSHQFSLPFPDHLASIRRYNCRWTVLPESLANLPCSQAEPSTLLVWLNAIFETTFSLTPEVETCLLEFIDDGCDLGHVYGSLRPWIRDIHSEDQFAGLQAAMRDRRRKDFALRSAALNSNRITNPRIPPRRVWDLYANRVLPYHALAPHPEDEKRLPKNLWVVSHSWVDPSERHFVLSSINGKAWHVPIPRATTLSHIRDELLILGAEYVFLDVLCLRQKDELFPESESIRKREWRLDVPTIGHIYNEDKYRPVIVYFNGLGLPLRNDPPDPHDRFHWVNRVWTLQETPMYAIIGGLEEKMEKINVYASDRWPLGINHALLSSLRTARWNKNNFSSAVAAIRSRSYSNRVDQVASLAYVLNCPTLPIYDADIQVEVAWCLLVECLPDPIRTDILFSAFDQSSSWRPTWEQIGTSTGFRYPVTTSAEEELRYIDGSSPLLECRHGFDAYYHNAYIIEECRIDVPQFPSRGLGSVYIPLAGGGGGYDAFNFSDWGKGIVKKTTYLLISVGNLQHWVVARAEGVRRIEGKRALEVSKVSTLTISYSDHSTFKRRVRGRSQLVVYR